jgi:hypothetical protein
MIKASCKICGFEKEFQDKFAGKIFKCPSCTTPIKIEPNDFIEEPKKEIPIENDKTFSNKKSEINSINKKLYILLASFVFIILSLLIFNSYKQRSKGTEEITVIDTPIATTVVKPEDYWKSKKVDNTKNIEEEKVEDKDLNTKSCGEFDLNLYKEAKLNFNEGYSYSYYFKTAWNYVKNEGEKSYNAVLYFEEAIKLNSENGGTYSDLGNCYRGGFKCYKKAEDAYNEAINKGFQKGFVYYNRAICRYENGNLDGMREDLQMAKEYGWSSDNYNLSNK